MGDSKIYLYQKARSIIPIVMKRNSEQIIFEILGSCSGGANKTKIVYQVNMNFKSIVPYLDLLLERDLIYIAQESPLVLYDTTHLVSP